MTLRIKSWNETFENHDSRKLKSLKWFAMPVELDSFGYTELSCSKDFMETYGVFCALLQVAAVAPDRGRLARKDGSPYSSKYLSSVTKIKRHVLEKAISELIDVGWILDDSEEYPDTPGDAGDFSRIHNRTGQEITEQEKTKHNRTAKPPTREEVCAYAQERRQHGPVCCPDWFYDYFEANNWHDSTGKPVRAWKQKFLLHSKRNPESSKSATGATHDANDSLDDIAADEFLEAHKVARAFGKGQKELNPITRAAAEKIPAYAMTKQSAETDSFKFEKKTFIRQFKKLATDPKHKTDLEALKK